MIRHYNEEQLSVPAFGVGILPNLVINSYSLTPIHILLMYLWPGLPTLWQQLLEVPFLFKCDNAPVQKARPEFGLEELVWPVQKPDLNPRCVSGVEL